MRAHPRSPRGASIAVRAALTAPRISLFVVAVVAVVAFGGAAAPALLRDAHTSTVQAALDEVAPAARDLTAITRGIPVTRAGTEETAARLADLEPVWGGAFRAADSVRDELPQPLRGVTEPPRITVSGDPVAAMTVDAAARPANRLQLTYDPFYESRVSFTSGSAPAREGAGSADAPAPSQIALSEQNAAALQWTIGEVRVIDYPGAESVTVVLTGIFAVDDDAHPDWSHLPTGARPGVVADPMGNLTYYASAFAAPSALDDAAAVSDSFTTQVWLPLAVEAVQGADAAEIATQIRGLAATVLPFDVVLTNVLAKGIAFRSTAPVAIDEAEERAAAMTAVVALVAVGPLVVTVIALGLAGRLLATRRVGSVRLANARGASWPALLALLAVEGAVLGVLGAAVGVLTAALSVGWDAPASLAVPLLVALTPAAVIPVDARVAAMHRDRADLGVARPSARRRRVLIELAVTGLAVGIVVLVMSRTDPTYGVDPVLLLVPVALAAVGCVLALRLIPLVLRVVESRGAQKADLLSLLGPARARRDPSVRAAPVLAVVVGIAIALFAVSFSVSVREGISVSSRTQVGADVRVDAAYLPDDQGTRLAQVDGVRATTSISIGTRKDAQAGTRDLPVIVYVVDSATLADVQRDDPATALPAPDALRDPSASDLPAVASESLIDVIADEDLTIDGTTIDVIAGGPDSSALGAAQTWIMIDAAHADRLSALRASTGVVLVALDEGADSSTVVAAAEEIVGPAAEVITPEGFAARLSGDPALAAVQAAVVASLVVVAALLGFAVGMTLVIGANSRGRLLALLSALGYPRRRELPLVMWEVAPALLIALPFGVLAGVAMPFLVLPAVDLSSFIGDSRQPDVLLGGWLPVAVVAAFALLSALAIAIATIVASRATAAAALRAIDEEG